MNVGRPASPWFSLYYNPAKSSRAARIFPGARLCARSTSRSRLAARDAADPTGCLRQFVAAAAGPRRTQPRSLGCGFAALCSSCLGGSRELVRLGGAPFSPALSPFVPHGARETDAPLVMAVPEKAFALSHRSAARGFEGLADACDLGADDAVGDVVVDESHGLHEGIDRGGADEFPTQFLKVSRQS